MRRKFTRKTPSVQSAAGGGVDVARRWHGGSRSQSHEGAPSDMASDIAGQIRVPDGNGKSSSILTEGEQRRMLLRCSHPNVSTFSGRVSRTAAIFSANLSRDRAMFVSKRRYVLESLHIAVKRPPRVHLPPERHRSQETNRCPRSQGTSARASWPFQGVLGHRDCVKA